MTIKQLPAILAALVILAGFAGCAAHQSPWAETADLRQTGREIAASLTASAKEPLDPQATVVTTTFVKIDDLKQSSTLGRALSGHVTSALNELGYRVVALNLTETLQMRDDVGELALSRDVSELLDKKLTADALITGTYYVARNHVYVTSRLVSPHSGEIFASHESRLPLTDDLYKLTLSGPGGVFRR